MRSASQSSMRSNRSGIGIAGCKPSLTPLPPDPASLVCTEYEAAASGARCTDNGLVQTDGDRRPSRSTNGSRYPRLVPSDLRLGLWQHRLRGVQGCRRPPKTSLLRLRACVVVSPASDVALAWRPLHARRAILHDLDAALPGQLRRGRCAFPPPPLASRAHRGCSGRTLWPHRRPLRVCRARIHFADRLRAGAGRRSGRGAGGGRVGFAGGRLF